MLNPANRLVAITPNDSTDLTASRIYGIYVGGAGNVAVLAKNDTVARTFTAPPVGSLIPVNAIKVMATGTTATLLIGLCS